MNTTLNIPYEDLEINSADHLPIAAAFCRRIGLIDTVNRSVPNEMEVDVGTIMQGMVLDTLSSRSPLYRLQEFFENQDTEVLLGREVQNSAFNDTTVARAMDAVFQAGAEKTFSDVAFQAARQFPLDTRYMHFDTTSVSVWGDYELCREHDEALNLTYGNSKDHRPDLKQFLIKMLCTNSNIPLLGGCENGNESDKNINNTLLTNISQHMARYGLNVGDFVYVADCAVVTEDNLTALGNNRFVTRLPFNYSEADRVVGEAVAEDQWEQLGSLADVPEQSSPQPAQYALAEKTVNLYGNQYRAIAVHSTAHDKRRRKRIDKQIRDSERSLSSFLRDEDKREYFCRADAEAAAARLEHEQTDLHRIEASVEEKYQYARGRPPKNRPRKVASIRYIVQTRIVEKPHQIERKYQEAGCFVLLTNIPSEGENAETGCELLRAYKDQYGIEHNYSFLKDPLIVNDLFLKKPERVEALGAVLLISLLIWNLIQYVLRQYINSHQTTLPGWDKKQTARPTAFMMSIKFAGVQILRFKGQRQLGRSLNTAQKRYLEALGLCEADMLSPYAVPG